MLLAVAPALPAALGGMLLIQPLVDFKVLQPAYDACTLLKSISVACHQDVLTATLLHATQAQGRQWFQRAKVILKRRTMGPSSQRLAN